MSRSVLQGSITRRQALGVLGATGGACLVARRGLGRWVPLERSGIVGTASADTVAALSCVVTPAETEGPYFVDERLERSDITVDPSDGSVSAGVPLRLKVSVYRVDDGCAPQPGATVDVWHADAQGTYSDVAQAGTTGRKYLRGYQVTDANGAVEFSTIYPGWYPGRAIHIHFKVRTFAGAEKTYEFTSQLYFDDAVSDQVTVLAPYSARGPRDTTNAEDSIFTGGSSGSSLLLALVEDGSGGWVGSFSIGLNGLPGASGACAELAACRTAVDAALPDPSAAADRKSRRLARRLAQLGTRAGRALDRAAAASGDKQTRELGKARKALEKLLTRARAADGQGTLGVSLAPLEQALTGLIALLPAA